MYSYILMGKSDKHCLIIDFVFSLFPKPNDKNLEDSMGLDVG